MKKNFVRWKTTRLLSTVCNEVSAHASQEVGEEFQWHFYRLS